MIFVSEEMDASTYGSARYPGLSGYELVPLLPMFTERV